MQNISYEDECDLHESEAVGTFSYEWFCTKTRFDTKAKGNSEITHSCEASRTLFLECVLKWFILSI